MTDQPAPDTPAPDTPSPPRGGQVTINPVRAGQASANDRTAAALERIADALEAANTTVQGTATP